MMELRLGKWEDVLGDIKEVDAVITDPPYSERTHKGFMSGNDIKKPAAIGINSYSCLSDKEIYLFSQHWANKVKDWIVIFSDHIGRHAWETELNKWGLLVFAPVGWVKPNHPRFQGDGPSCTIEWITIARPRKKVKRIFSRPGHYHVKHHASDREKQVKDCHSIIGKKEIVAMRNLIKDYSEPNDLICDPYAGSGTTLLAAAIEGRRAIGAEMDPNTFKLAVKRLSKGYTPNMFAGKERWRSGLTGELL
jgi:site-specific DNA-methyltransferase (adenine-specific)